MGEPKAGGRTPKVILPSVLAASAPSPASKMMFWEERASWFQEANVILNATIAEIVSSSYCYFREEGGCVGGGGWGNGYITAGRFFMLLMLLVAMQFVCNASGKSKHNSTTKSSGKQLRRCSIIKLMRYSHSWLNGVKQQNKACSQNG